MEPARAEVPRAPEPAEAGPDAPTLYSSGIKALNAGHADKAIELFTRCIKADRGYCLCYRANGITYARAGNGPRAYHFYKQYLSVCPHEKDADQVRTLLQQYEATQ